MAPRHYLGIGASGMGIKVTNDRKLGREQIIEHLCRRDAARLGENNGGFPKSIGLVARVRENGLTIPAPVHGIGKAVLGKHGNF
jgi:hypothetical protein